jgi:hypothetical protein
LPRLVCRQPSLTRTRMVHSSQKKYAAGAAHML